MIRMIFPRVAYVFLPVAQALPNSIGLTVLVLALVDVIKVSLAGSNLTRSALEVIEAGALSAGGGYLLGVAISCLFSY